MMQKVLQLSTCPDVQFRLPFFNRTLCRRPTGPGLVHYLLVGFLIGLITDPSDGVNLGSHTVQKIYMHGLIEVCSSLSSYDITQIKVCILSIFGFALRNIQESGKEIIW